MTKKKQSGNLKNQATESAKTSTNVTGSQKKKMIRKEAKEKEEPVGDRILSAPKYSFRVEILPQGTDQPPICRVFCLQDNDKQVYSLLDGEALTNFILSKLPEKEVAKMKSGTGPTDDVLSLEKVTASSNLTVAENDGTPVIPKQAANTILSANEVTSKEILHKNDIQDLMENIKIYVTMKGDKKPTLNVLTNSQVEVKFQLSGHDPQSLKAKNSIFDLQLRDVKTARSYQLGSFRLNFSDQENEVASIPITIANKGIFRLTARSKGENHLEGKTVFIAI